MATNYNRTLYKDYLSEVLAKEALQKQVQILRVQCDKLKLYANGLENEKNKLANESSEKDATIQSLFRSAAARAAGESAGFGFRTA